jgi:hypothetical protein
MTLQDMIQTLDLMRSDWYSLMYTCISDDKTFLKEMPGTNYKKRKLLDELIEHFTETEEYEKCAELVKLKRW